MLAKAVAREWDAVYLRVDTIDLIRVNIADEWRLGRLTSMGCPVPRGKLYLNEPTKTGHGLISCSIQRKNL